MNKQQTLSDQYKEFERLLAKSSQKPDSPKSSELLNGHTALVVSAAETLLEETADELIEQLGLDASVWRDRLTRAVKLGAFLHDFGKANDQFQNMVRRKRDIRNAPQSIRHEALSGIVCTQIAELRSWLCPPSVTDSNLIFQAAICAVVGHHLKTNKAMRDSADFELKVYLNHDDFKRLLHIGKNRLGFDDPPEFDKPVIYSLNDEQSKSGQQSLPALKRKLYVREFSSWFVRADQEMKKWLAAVKALVVAADVAGSALPRADESIKKWIHDALNETLSAEDLEKLVAERLKGSEANQARDDFQRSVKESQDRVTLVCAGCGAGKTAAAYLWASRRVDNRKLFFCYPTTGTASEGFNSYVTKSKIEGALMHSRSIVDLENILGTQEDSIEVDEQGKIKEVPDLRLESLQTWSPPLVVCTVDTVLGLIQNNRRGLYSFPAFGRAAFVFDEIHSYDHRLFSALLDFLKTFQGADVLLMTASLPVNLLNELEKVCGKLTSIQGPKAREDAPRYKIKYLKDNTNVQAWAMAEETLRQDKKVLWVVNKVDRAIKLYEEAEEGRRKELFKNKNLLAHLYHSRFRYFERREKHADVVEAFDPQKKGGAAFAITTQVAEMSLDLSADLLITDLAPPASLIQRMGRLNRHEDEPNEAALALILEPDNAAPYSKPDGKPSEDFLSAYQWLNLLRCDPETVSQTDLALTLEQISQDAKAHSRRADSAWLTGVWNSQVDVLRASDFSVPIVLERDVKKIRESGEGLPEAEKRLEMRKEAIRRSLSIPGRSSVNCWKRLEEHGLFRIAPDDEVGYCKETGARWKK